MKKFNKNIILFVVCFLIVAFGFNKPYFESLADSAKDFSAQIEEVGIFSAFDAFTADIEDASTVKIAYHNALMDINSIKDNLLNTRIITKGEDTIIKTDSGSLVKAQGYISDSELDTVVEKIQKLYSFTKNSDAQFLYVAAPQKGYGVSLPKNVDDYRTENTDRFLSKMQQAEIPTLDLIEKLTDQNIMSEDLFFVTDHHWTPNTAFWANAQICNTLNEYYGFKFNEQFNNLKNYNIKTYKNHFLGSYGKKTGTYFARGGADDIDIITPNFETKLIEEQPIKSQIRSGDFTQTVMYMENVEGKDYYAKNPYAAYCGGDFRLQIVKNELNPDGDKILLIRDSYACAVAPFLSLNASELHITDIRDFGHFVGEKMDMYKYIEKIKPDYVIVLYNGVESIETSNSKYEW